VLRQRVYLLTRYGLPMLVDAVSVVISLYLALTLRFAGQAPLSYLLQFRRYVLGIAFVYCLFNVVFGLYGRLWQYASSLEIVSIVESVATSVLVLVAVDLLGWAKRPLPISVILAGGSFTLGAFSASRYRWRLVTAFLRRWQSPARHLSSDEVTRVLIVGAGECGQLLAWRLKNQGAAGSYRIVGFVDDDRKKQGMRLHGAKVLGGRQMIREVVDREAVELIVVAIHTISPEDFRDIVEVCQTTSARIKTLPNVFDSLESLGDDSLLRDITIADVVGRETVSMDRELCRRLLRDKVVLVTGAAGSIGSELSRQVAQYEPRLLIMLDNNETGLFDLATEMRTLVDECDSCPEDVSSRWRYVVADVTLRYRTEQILREYRPQIILHVAAYKHVPLMEEHPMEAIRVNVGGTLTLLELADAYGAERLVFVSTDKAVDPVNVMGATKRLGEMLVANFDGGTRLITTAVRFGNVLGSRGSVVPLFERQIDEGGPVTVTHPEVARFFMTVSEAAGLVLEAASLAQGGEVFILEMGDEVKISDLASTMIRLRGLRVGEDIPIIYTGMRPGEKMHEVLVASLEKKHPTSHPQIYRVHSSQTVDGKALLHAVRDLLGLAEKSRSCAELQEKLFAIARPLVADAVVEPSIANPPEPAGTENTDDER